jgi:hypothetical protein
MKAKAEQQPAQANQGVLPPKKGVPPQSRLSDGVAKRSASPTQSGGTGSKIDFREVLRTPSVQTDFWNGTDLNIPPANYPASRLTDGSSLGSNNQESGKTDVKSEESNAR